LKKIGITMGDPLGIGPEIIVKALKKTLRGRNFEPIIIGSEQIMKNMGWQPRLAPLINITCKKIPRFAKTPNKLCGGLSFKSFHLGVHLARKKKIDALVTAPISKEAWKLAGIKYQGHTDYFRKTMKKEPLMCFVCGNLRVALLTEHIPLRNVSGYFKTEIVIKKSAQFSAALKMLGVKRPKICLAAVNPHAGDSGIIGREEKNLSRLPAYIKGPFPSDRAWLELIKGNFDGLIAAYHDQGILPLKILAGPAGFLHWTFGPDFTRTSPGHGTAFDLAGKGTANPEGMIEAIKFAVKYS